MIVPAWYCFHMHILPDRFFLNFYYLHLTFTHFHSHFHPYTPLHRESGTSASAPVFAAMVTLWNDIRLAYGQPPMGFIAPFLYFVYETSPDAFQDIVTGNNVSVCGGVMVRCVYVML